MLNESIASYFFYFQRFRSQFAEQNTNTKVILCFSFLYSKSYLFLLVLIYLVKNEKNFLDLSLFLSFCYDICIGIYITFVNKDKSLIATIYIIYSLTNIHVFLLFFFLSTIFSLFPPPLPPSSSLIILMSFIYIFP